jgi:malonate-semialdehyde dehydrogenase (acetylating)/methylmalonate-semialdehyde dehydrogenase
MAETCKNYVAGEWVGSSSGQFRQVLNPATAEVLAEVPMSTEEEVDAAIAAANGAFEEWRRTPAVSRATYLFRLRGRLEDEFEALARTITLEHGKSLDESRGEIRRAIQMVEMASGIPSLMQGYNSEDIAPGIDEHAVIQPLGAFACLAPFNFPAMVPYWFLPFAVATGNTYIVKPSPIVPLSMARTFEILDELDLPPGVVNLVNGGEEAATALITSPEIKGTSFVGSSKVARIVYKTCSATGQRVQAQGGAKNFLTVMPDADLDKAVPNMMTSAYGCTGQRCLSGSVVLAVGGVYEDLKARLVDAASQLRVGNGLDEGVDLGPLTTREKKENVLKWIDVGLEEGAELVLDGRGVKVDDCPNGFFVGPTIFDKVAPGMRIAQEEIFGPVLAIVRVKDLDEAIETVNGSRYGNASSIYTRNGRAAREYSYRVECGNIGINVGVVAPMAFFPFGGRKESFFGDLHGQGMDVIQFFTDRKIVIQRWL